MKIKMLTLSAGPNGVYPIDSVVDLSDDEAQGLIQGGFAVAFKSESVIETAEAEPAPEHAVIRKGKATGKRKDKG